MLLALAGEARATNGAKLLAVGTRAGGRAGVDTAIADDATALGTNPAGIGFIDGQRLDSNIAAYRPSVRWQNPVDQDKGGNPSIGAIVGGSAGFCFDLDDTWRLGEALAFDPESPSDVPSRYSTDYDRSGLKIGVAILPAAGAYVHLSAFSPLYDRSGPGPQPWNSELKEVGWTLGIAWRISRILSIGFAPQLITALPGFKQLDDNQPVTQPVSILKGHPFANTQTTYGDLAPFVGARTIEGSGDMSDVHTFGFRLRLGVLLVPVQWETGQWSLGLSYASQSFKQDYLGKVKVDFTRQMNVLDPQGTLIKSAIAANTGIAEVDQHYVGEWNMRLSPLNAPQEVSIGNAEQLSRLLLALDLTWINWSATEDKVHGRLTNGTSIELNELIGGGNAPLDIPLNWKDQLVVAVGASVSATDWLTLRAGYNYAKNPVPANTLQPNKPAIFEHHVTCGLSFYVRRLEVSLAYEHDFEKKVHVGENIANSDVSNSDITASLDAASIGFGLRF